MRNVSRQGCLGCLGADLLLGSWLGGLLGSGLAGRRTSPLAPAEAGSAMARQRCRSHRAL